MEEHGIVTCKPSDASRLIGIAIKANRPILLSGPPGGGKSSLFEQAAVNEDMDFITSHPVMSDPTDYKGLGFAIEKNGETIADFLPMGEIGALLRSEKPTLWLVDDIGNAPPAVQAALMRPLLERKVNMTKIPDHVAIGAATNRRHDKTGIFGVLGAVKSRFGMSVELVADLDDWCRWALQHNVRTDIIAHKRYRPEMLCRDEKHPPTGDMEKEPDQRAWHMLSDLLNANTDQSLEFVIAAGCVGRAAGSDFISFRRIYSSLPNIDQVLLNPAKFEMPTDPAVAYAFCGALASKTSQNTFDRICKVVDRMPPEFGVLTIKDCLAKDASVAATRAFIEWSANNADVVIG